MLKWLNKYKLFLLIPLLILMFFIRVFDTAPSSSNPKRLYGVPVISTEYPNLQYSGIDQVVDDGHRMYIMYTSNDGIVQVSDMQGTYLYTLFFRCDLNGGFFLATEEDTLYVEDMSGAVYRFHGGKFDCFLEREDARAQWGHIDFRSPSDNYKLRGSELWRVSPCEEVCVIKDAVHINYLQKLVSGIMWVLLGAIVIYKMRFTIKSS
jgi:hypothetical protein